MAIHSADTGDAAITEIALEAALGERGQGGMKARYHNRTSIPETRINSGRP